MVKEKQIYSLKNPYWLDNAGFSKGKYHDRQELGIILNAGSIIKIRLKSNNFAGMLTLRLLNDDSKTEMSKEFGTNWIEVKAEYTSVPFIDTPYMSEEMKLEVEFEYSLNSKELPIYYNGLNQNDFFYKWDSIDADFALISLKYNVLLVPKRNKDYLKSLSSIETVSLFYEDYFNFINNLAGISFEPNTEISNLNSPNRYFMKADKNGAGAAYYGSHWTAESSLSIKSFWLEAELSNWGCFHEIAHGYQGNFMSDLYFSSGEVWNNIYAACYQEERLGTKKYKEGWLYDYGGGHNVEKTIINYINENIPVDNWDLRSKLVFYMMMIKKAGDDSFTHFNQSYRESINFPDENDLILFGDNVLFNMLSKSFADKSHYNMVPFIKRTGGFISERLTDYNISTFTTPVYPLFLLIEEENLFYVREKLNTKENIELVNTNQLSTLDDTRNVKIEFNINDFDEIKNDIVSVFRGDEIIHEQIISEKTIKMDIPIGIYNLRLPIGKRNSYTVDSWNLIVDQKNRKKIFNYDIKYNSNLLNQSIGFFGLGDESFGVLTVSQEKKIIIIQKGNGSPHSYYKNELYAKITIKNNNGITVYSADINGDMDDDINDTIPFEYGYEIIIYHAETHGRLKSVNNSGEIINPESNFNTLIIHKRGVINNSIADFTKETIISKIENEASLLRSNVDFLNNSIITKDNINLAINNFESELRDKLRNEYHDCLPNKQDNILPGPFVNFIFKGIGDWEFFDVNIDMLKNEITISTKEGIPHHYFDELYTSFFYIGRNNEILYRIEIYGNKTLKENKVTLPISGDGGEHFYLYHAEPLSRVVIRNNDKRVFNSAEHQYYTLTKNGLAVSDKRSLDKDTTLLY